MKVVTDLVQSKKNVKPTFSHAEKTFQRLKKKLESLQQDSKVVKEELDECLLYYHHHLAPMKKEYIDEVKKFVIIVYGFYKDKKQFSPQHRDVLEEILQDKMDLICQSMTPCTLETELAVIFEDLHGASYESIVSSELDELKQEMQDMFREEGGIDIDLSSIEKEDREEGVLKKIFEAMQASGVGQKEEEMCKPKNKKQIQKEQKAKEFEALQKRELSTIYKQLAKVFHPDLEQDFEEKLEKEVLMKRLTSAYDAGDLHTLLLLEMEWMNRSENQGKVHSEDQLKIYNSLLKDQIQSLEGDIQMTMLHPRYLAIQPYLGECSFGPLMALQIAYHGLQTSLVSFRKIVADLQGERAIKVIRGIIKQEIAESRLRDFW